MSDVQSSMWNDKYSDLEACAKMHDARCAIKLALNNMNSNCRLKDRTGNVDYKKAENLLVPITGTSPTARYLLALIKVKQKKIDEAKILMLSAGTENFLPAMDSLTHQLSWIYANNTDEDAEVQSLKWAYKSYTIEPDTAIALNIAMHFIQAEYKDCPAAVQWFARVTEGHYANINAQHLLGEQYEAGNCVPQDYVMAYMMYDLGGTAAAEQKHALAKKMTPEQINEGIVRSHQWQDENHSHRVGYGDGVPIYWNVHTTGN